MIKKTIVLGLFLAIGGCLHLDPLDLSNLDSVNEMEIDLSSHETNTIVDHKTISRWKTFVALINNNWYEPWDTFPTPQETISFKKDDKLILVLWVGQDWIGERSMSQGPKTSRLRKLSENENDMLNDLLDTGE